MKWNTKNKMTNRFSKKIKMKLPVFKKNIMKNHIFITIAIAFLLSGCTNNLYRTGVKDYEKMAYHNSIVNLEKYLKKHDGPADAKIKLANAYRFVNDIPNAEKWYAKVVLLPESDPINMCYYGKTLMGVGKYEDAKVWFNKYLDKVPDDFVVEMLLVSCNSISTFKKDTTLFTIKEAEIPEVASAFSQVLYGDGIIFSADKISFKASKTSNWTGRSYLDLYFTKKDHNGKWLNPSLLKGSINGAFHEGPACFNKAGNVVYFTRSNYIKRKLRKSTKDENNLKLFRAELKGDEWGNVTELPFNSDEYSCGHPTLSADDKTLYFISDMPESLGGTDIYKTVLDSVKNTWSKPENVGNTINTTGNEMFPYMHPDGTFYFSSDSHNSIGGLDVFMTSYDGKNWLQIENLNYPLNTSKDDFAFTFNNNDKTGYISSNRNTTDKIYEITKNEPVIALNVSGYVNQKGKPKQPIDSVIVEITNLTENTKEKVLTNSAGEYFINVKNKCDFSVKAWKPMFFTITPPQNISTAGKKLSEKFIANFELDEIIMEKPIVLENIYYDLDKWEIRQDATKELDRLVQLLVDNPELHIELSSHTDSRSGDQYNLVLSDKRAKAAVGYIVSKGIDVKRMKYKGYGESKLVNRCENAVVCTEEEHQKNRRTEFKAIKNDILTKK